MKTNRHLQRKKRFHSLLLGMIFVLGLITCVFLPRPGFSTTQKMIVLGFDGMDPQLLQKYMYRKSNNKEFEIDNLVDYLSDNMDFDREIVELQVNQLLSGDCIKSINSHNMMRVNWV